MLGRRTVRIILGAAASVVASFLLVVLTTEGAFAHGYTTAPISRAYFCKLGTAKNCGSIQWEPQSVEGPKGFPNAGPADGTICSAGNSMWAPLNDQRNGAWPVNNLRSGGSYTFQWTLTARHATTDFRYFVTRPGWSQNTPLTRAALNLTPIKTVPMYGAQPPANVSHTVTLPALSGRHMILAVWTIADTGNAFYQCSDVVFG